MHDRTPKPPFPDACRTGRIENINNDSTIVGADGTERRIRWRAEREGR